MTRVADYVAKKIADIGVRHVFMLTGGGAMHLNDAFGLEKRLQIVCNQHEQACAIAAEGYARVKQSLSVVCVTTGPGGTNAMTGVLGQWLDSIPTLYISGQVRYDTTVESTHLPLRQYGDQEANIIEMVKPITKYAYMVTDPMSIAIHLEKAIHLATSGRPGPVWLDIPLNVQSSLIDETRFSGHTNEKESISGQWIDQTKTVLEKIKKAERPVILAGAGVRLSGAAELFFRLAEILKIPVQVAWDAIDLFPSNHELYAGRPGTVGQRGANFIFQNADLIISIGCRLNIRQIGYTFPSVGRAAYKISVDIDENELKKPSLKIDLPIQADAKEFIDLMLTMVKEQPVSPKKQWLDWCKERIHKYPVVLPEYYQKKQKVNPYVFSKVLSEKMSFDDIVVSSNGASCVMPIQAMDIRKGQRHIVNSGCAAMGYGLPSAIGACFANNKKRVICLEGDGSIQLNIQELETIKYHNLPVKIFLFNNDGYLSIRTTQKSYFNGNFVGEGKNSGVGMPDFIKIARAYGIKGVNISSMKNLEKEVEDVLNFKDAVFCNVIMDPDQMIIPRVSSRSLPDGRMISSPLEDMYPFLEDEEFLSNMLIPKWQN